MGYNEFQNELRKYKEKQVKCNHEKTIEFVFGCEASWGHNYEREAQYNQYVKYFRF